MQRTARRRCDLRCYVFTIYPYAASYALPASRSLILCLVRQKTMSRFESITIREVEFSDLETFYEHQLDPEAIRMAAFVGKDPKEKATFDAHWNKILNSSPQNTTRTIVAEEQLAGHIACYPHGEKIECH